MPAVRSRLPLASRPQPDFGGSLMEHGVAPLVRGETTTLQLVTDYDCWRPEGEVKVIDALTVLRRNVVTAQKILRRALAGLDATRACACQRSLDDALVTPPDKIPSDARERLGLLLARRLAPGVMTTIASTAAEVAQVDRLR